MCRRYLPKIFIICFSLTVCALCAATVSWQSSTDGNRWADKGAQQTTAWDNDQSNYISIDETKMLNEIDGWGGCFNEKGWKAIIALPKAGQDSIMKAMFDTVTGLKFNICRIPIGCTDYALSLYTLDDNAAGDYTMSKFSIERDKQYLIPYIKAAQAIRPDLKIWGSPWTAPGWMKTTNNILGGSLNSDAQTKNAYALYFEKFYQAYLAEGIRIFAIHHQNEPKWNNNGWLITHWEPSDYRDFVKNYLGPKFKADDLPLENWCGTIVQDDPPNYLPTVFGDTLANAFCTGAAVQYSTNSALWMHTNYPSKRIMLSETPAGGGDNNWTDAENNWNAMRDYLKNGVNLYMQWNMVLDQTGKDCYSGARQSTMITADTTQKKVILTPQYFQIKHITYYVKPGAYRIESAGNYTNAIAFRNPDGQNVLVVANTNGSDATVAINLNGQKIKPVLPAHSFNTFCISGTAIPAVSALNQNEAEKYTTASGIYNRPGSEGGTCVSYINNNDWAVYNNLDFANGANVFDARVAGTVGGKIEIRFDSLVATPVGTCTVDPTGGASTWKTVTCALNSTIKGKHTLYLKFKGTGTGNLFDLNWWQFRNDPSGVTVHGTKAIDVNSINVISGAGKSQSLQLEFSHGISKDNLNVCLFDLNGRQVATLFKGILPSSHLVLPLNREEVVPGAYIIKVSMNGKITMTKTAAIR